MLVAIIAQSRSGGPWCRSRGPPLEHRRPASPRQRRTTLSFARSDSVVAGDDGDVGQAAPASAAPELAAPAVHLVGGGPRRHPGRHQAFQPAPWPAPAWWRTPAPPGSRPSPAGPVLGPRSGMYTSKSAQACPRAVTRRRTPWSRSFPPSGHPACCGATHAVAVPFLSWAVSSIAMPGPIRSSSWPGIHAAASAGSCARSSFQSHW